MRASILRPFAAVCVGVFLVIAIGACGGGDDVVDNQNRGDNRVNVGEVPTMRDPLDHGRLVLCVGIEHYDGDFPTVPGALDDARTLTSRLQRSEHPDRVHAQVLLDAGATKASMTAAVADLARRATVDDHVMIYFTGLGAVVDLPPAPNSPVGLPRLWVLPADADAGLPRETYVELEPWLTPVFQSAALSVTVVIDAGFARGPRSMTRQQGDAGLLRGMMDHYSEVAGPDADRQIWLAADPFTPFATAEGDGGSAFADAFVASLDAATGQETYRTITMQRLAVERQLRGTNPATAMALMSSANTAEVPLVVLAGHNGAVNGAIGHTNAHTDNTDTTDNSPTDNTNVPDTISSDGAAWSLPNKPTLRPLAAWEQPHYFTLARPMNLQPGGTFLLPDSYGNAAFTANLTLDAQETATAHMGILICADDEGYGLAWVLRPADHAHALLRYRPGRTAFVDGAYSTARTPWVRWPESLQEQAAWRIHVAVRSGMVTLQVEDVVVESVTVEDLPPGRFGFMCGRGARATLSDVSIARR